MKELTKVEEEIMQALWKLKIARVADIMKQLDRKNPSYNTVSTIVRILQDKGFVDYEKQGRGYRYFPTVDKESYRSSRVNSIVNNYFNGSFKNMLSFFIKNKELNMKDLEDILDQSKNKGQ